MKDINGVSICVGDIVTTVQPSGGVLPPAPATTGEVVASIPWDVNSGLAIRYIKEGTDYYRYILLYGKINEVVERRTITEITINLKLTL